MTVAQKLAMLKSLLKITDTTQDAELTVFLTFAQNEIINWRYGTANNTPLIRAAFDDDYGKAYVSATVFIAALTPANGKYVFTYSTANESWQYASADVELVDYGISYTGLDPQDGDTITVKYNDRCLADCDMTQIMACVVGYGLSGAEGESSHNENGIQRSFKYPEMISFIHSNINPYVGVI